MGSFGVDKAVVYRYELLEEVGSGEFFNRVEVGKVYKGHWDPGAWASASCAQVPEES